MTLSVSAIVTAAGKNRRMQKDQNARELPRKNKLLLDIQGKPVIAHTLERVLNTSVEECVVVLGHFKSELMDFLDNMDDGRIRIVENIPEDVHLSQSLLNGVKNSKGELCLCAAADQPTVTTSTFSHLIDKVKSYKNPENILSVLSRGQSGYLDTAEGLGMPFSCHRNILEKYLPQYSGNINPILREMIKNNVVFYGLECENELELVNINKMNDYELILNNFKE